MDVADPSVNREINRIAPLAPSAWLRLDVVQRVLPPGVIDVLEIGCGRGGFGARLAQRSNYVGLEPDYESWAVAKARVGAVGRGEVRNEASDALADERFDLVCAFEVLEHIEHDAAAVAEWAALLRPHGWLLLSVPADQRRFGPVDEMAGHFRRYDREGMTALLTEAGFSEIEIRRYGYPLGYVLEALKNLVAKRRLAAMANQSIAERTAGSGRFLQPSGGLYSFASRWVTMPFRLTQRAVPQAGTGMVVLARRTD
jgi:SAM-dependent methyltransferase